MDGVAFRQLGQVVGRQQCRADIVRKVVRKGLPPDRTRDDERSPSIPLPIDRRDQFLDPDIVAVDQGRDELRESVIRIDLQHAGEKIAGYPPPCRVSATLSPHGASRADVADRYETPDAEGSVRLRSDLPDRMSWRAEWRSSDRESASTPAPISRCALRIRWGSAAPTRFASFSSPFATKFRARRQSQPNLPSSTRAAACFGKSDDTPARKDGRLTCPLI